MRIKARHPPRIDDMLPSPRNWIRWVWSLESWGGRPLMRIRYLGEDPWERIRLLKEVA